MAHVQTHDYGNVADKTCKSSGALFTSDSLFAARGIHVIITSIHTVPQGQDRHGGTERQRDVEKVEGQGRWTAGQDLLEEDPVLPEASARCQQSPSSGQNQKRSGTRGDNIKGQIYIKHCWEMSAHVGKGRRAEGGRRDREAGKGHR
ncbi:unnamed protein product [Pleuronectes platessa]|uniref:Uncharacterized protein n=1 Tax=Pleuronectes platessa TaxID=8262 RepID=A0A9N7U509_PLEPL|nr:unnamed protein product [Pleuronectes platessa]